MVKQIVFISVFFILPLLLTAQREDSLAVLLSAKTVTAYIDKISSASGKISASVDKKSQKALTQLKKQEASLYKKLTRMDSGAAAELRAASEMKHRQLEAKLKEAQKLTQYVPGLDTASTALRFLQQTGIAKNVKRIDEALQKIKELEGQLQKAENIKQFLKERRQLLKAQLEKFGLTKELKKFNKQLYYYSQQFNEYKALLNDPKKIEHKAVELLSKTKLFQDFFRKHSMLASLFRMPGDPNDPNYMASLAGLQTRASVNSLIQQTIAAGGPDGQAQFNQNIQAAQTQLQQLKDKVNQWGSGGSSEDIMPENFKPNSQKTKSFLQRVELGTNFQSQKSTNYFPVTSDIGLSVGYKLNDNSIIGIGASYKLGWGSGWNNIRLSSQGAGIRSFIDWKIKGSFWITGGYEQNYKTAFRYIDQLRNYSAWQTSGLIGLSKTVSVKTKFFKKSKLQLLWDFLSYRQVPRGQPVVFRVGYNF
jgi:hypothetical protein